MEIGVYSFVEATADPVSGETVTPARRLRDLIEEIELADQVGLDVFGVGEHHRVEYISSAPAVVLAAAARSRSRIRLTSAVSVLSSDDPVRVFQSFATLDLLSEGRAEIMAGRGSFIESFPLFGYDLDDYDSLFAEKLELLMQLRASERVSWSGRHRPPIRDRPVYPRPAQDELPIWVAVGGTPESVVRTARLGLPMALAIIGGQPERFVPFVELHRNAVAEAGHGPLPVSINGHGYLADTTERAIDESYPPHAAVTSALGAERGWPPTTREHYETGCAADGPYLVGDPATVAEKILRQHELLGHERLLIQLSVGTMPHQNVMHAIELLGTQVARQCAPRSRAANLLAPRGFRQSSEPSGGAVVAVTSVFIVVLFSLIVTRVATVTLITTGLSRETARFQARSALSGVGFTTSEAETMLRHPVRRRLAMFLMLFGSAGIVTVVASVIISFTNTNNGREALWRSLVLVGGLTIVLLISRSSWVDRRLTRLIAASLTRFTDIEARDYAALLNLSNGFTVAELHIEAGDWVAGRTLAELGLHDEGIAVLGLQRGMNDAYVGVPIDETPVLPGDTTVVYGQASRIAELDARRAGPVGDAAHQLAVADHVENDMLESTTDAAEMMNHDEMRSPRG